MSVSGNVSITYFQSFWDLLAIHLLVHVVVEFRGLGLQTSIRTGLSLNRTSLSRPLYSTLFRSLLSLGSELILLVVVLRHFLY